MKSSQLIRQGKFEEAMKEINQMMRNEDKEEQEKKEEDESQRKQEAEAYYLRG